MHRAELSDIPVLRDRSKLIAKRLALFLERRSEEAAFEIELRGSLFRSVFPISFREQFVFGKNELGATHFLFLTEEG